MQTMKKDENAVSPVIGVILMVVITVIIAAILAVFAFGIGAPKNAPVANLKYEIDAPDMITISHGGGDPLVLADEKLILNDAATPGIPEEIEMADCARVGDPTVKTLTAGNAVECAYTSLVVVGGIYRVQVLDKPTGQLVSDTRVVAQ